MHTHPMPLAVSQTAGSTEHGESFHQQYRLRFGEHSDGRDREACYSSQINTSLAPARDIPTRGCQLPATLPAGFTGSRRGCKTTGFPSAGQRHAPAALWVAGVASLISSVKRTHMRWILIPFPPRHRSLVWGLGKRDGLGKVPPHPTSEPHHLLGGELLWRWRWEAVPAFWPPSRVPYHSSAGVESQRMSHCSPAPRPLPVPVGLRDKQKQSQTQWGGGWACSPPPDPAATPQAGRQADRRMPALGEWAGTPLFLAASASPPPSFRGPKIHGLDGQAKSLR